MKKSEEYFTAIHEAGHLVCDLKYNPKRVKHISIIPNESSYGRMVTQIKLEAFKKLEHGELTPHDEVYFKRCFIGLMTGPYSEAKYRKLKDFKKVGAGSDLSQMVDIAFSILSHKKVTEAYIAYILEEAKAFVNLKINWTLIKAFADELYKVKEMNKKQIMDFYYNHHKMII